MMANGATQNIYLLVYYWRRSVHTRPLHGKLLLLLLLVLLYTWYYLVGKPGN